MRHRREGVRRGGRPQGSEAVTRCGLAAVAAVAVVGRFLCGGDAAQGVQQHAGQPEDGAHAAAHGRVDQRHLGAQHVGQRSPKADHLAVGSLRPRRLAEAMEVVVVVVREPARLARPAGGLVRGLLLLPPRLAGQASSTLRPPPRSRPCTRTTRTRPPSDSSSDR